MVQYYTIVSTFMQDWKYSLIIIYGCSSLIYYLLNDPDPWFGLVRFAHANPFSHHHHTRDLCTKDTWLITVAFWLHIYPVVAPHHPHPPHQLRLPLFPLCSHMHAHIEGWQNINNVEEKTITTQLKQCCKKELVAVQMLNIITEAFSQAMHSGILY